MIEPSVIEVRGGFALGCAMVRLSALRCGDWAVHRQIGLDGRFGLTLLPLGLCLPQDWATFARVTDAVSAMRQIARMRNDWAVIMQSDLTKSLEDRLKSVCSRCGAVASPVGISSDADQPMRGPAGERLNGYSSKVA